MARPTRFERVTFAFGGQRSRYAASPGIALSTSRKNRVLRLHPGRRNEGHQIQHCEVLLPGLDFCQTWLWCQAFRTSRSDVTTCGGLAFAIQDLVSIEGYGQTCLAVSFRTQTISPLLR